MLVGLLRSAMAKDSKCLSRLDQQDCFVQRLPQKVTDQFDLTATGGGTKVTWPLLTDLLHQGRSVLDGFPLEDVAKRNLEVKSR